MYWENFSLRSKMHLYRFFSRFVTSGGIFCLFEFSLSFFRFLCVSADSSVFHQILMRLLSDFCIILLRFSVFRLFFSLFTFSLTPAFPALSIETTLISKCDRLALTESICSIFTFIQLFPWCWWMRVLNRSTGVFN